MNEAQQLQQMQPLLYKQLQKSFEHGRLAHAYLFEGDTGTGKQEFGLWMAMTQIQTVTTSLLPAFRYPKSNQIDYCVLYSIPKNLV